MKEHLDLLTEKDIRSISNIVQYGIGEFNGTVSLEEITQETVARLVVFINQKLRNVQ